MQPARDALLRRWWVVPLAAAILLGGVNALLWQWTERRRVADLDKLFQARAELLVRALDDELDHDADALRAVRGFAQSSATPTADLWRDFLDSLDARARYPSITAFQYLARVDARDRADYDRQARAEGRPALWDLQNGAGQPPRQADMYFPILFMEPGSPAALSLDASCRPDAWRETQDPSAALGELRLGAAIRSVRDPDRPVLPVYAAFYQPGAPPSTPEARRASLRGFVALLLNPDSLFRHAPDSTLLDYTIRDGDTSGPVIHERASGHRASLPFAHQETLQVLGRAWTVEVRPTAWWDALGRGESWQILLSGLAISVGIVAALAGLARARSRALALADRMTLELRETNRTLLELATTDPLTGLLNRRALETRASEEEARASREALPLSVILVDVDFFKHVNDKYGHDMGDVVLRNLGHFLRENTRLTDHPARMGGEEFLVLLSNTAEGGAVALAEHLRSGFEAMEHVHGVTRIKCTASFGVAVSPAGRGVSVARLQVRADKALYQAKEGGRNRVVLWKAPPRGEDGAPGPGEGEAPGVSVQ